MERLAVFRQVRDGIRREILNLLVNRTGILHVHSSPSLSQTLSLVTPGGKGAGKGRLMSNRR